MDRIETETVNTMAVRVTHRPPSPFPGPKLAVLDPSKMGTRATVLEKMLRQLICGHDETILEIVKIYQRHLAGLNPVDRPLGAFLFVGPTGSGKIRAVEAIANSLFGSPRAMIRIGCAEFRHSYDITKLIGSPRGYPEQRQNRPILTQAVLDQYHTDALKLSVLVFEEIEKASQAMWKRLFTMLDEGELVLSDKRKVDLSRTLIFLTSTVGEAYIGSCFRPKYGLLNSAPDNRSNMEAARQKFTSEFLDRLDRIEVFGTFGCKESGQVIDSEIQIVQQLLQSSGGRFFIDVTESARQFLFAEGAYCRFGTCLLKRAIDRSLLRPLSTLIVTGQFRDCDRIRVTHIGASPNLTFFREEDEGEGWRPDEAAA